MTSSVFMRAGLCAAMAFALHTLEAAASTTVIGNVSCQRWLQDRAAGLGERSGVTVAGLAGQVWLVGLMSGINVMAPTDQLKSIDAFTIYEWMDNYCEANPASSLFDGGQELFVRLAEPIKK